MNHYRTSKGERVSKSYIDNQIRIAKSNVLSRQKAEYGYNFCTQCGRNGNFTFLDCAHIISVDNCQKNSRAELAYDTKNIKVLCRECHQQHDKLTLQFKTTCKQ